jgi:restriction system protein
MQMRFKMSENSLFAILLRSPWWVSLLVAIGVSLIARLAFPDNLTPYALISGFPFLVIAGVAFFKQMRNLSPAQTAAILGAAGALSWREFSVALEQGLVRDGYRVERIEKGGADFALAKGVQEGVLAAKRWKAASHGIEALRELQALREKREVREAVYVAGGELSEQARNFARDNAIRLLQGEDLARLLNGYVKPAAK